MQTFQEYLSHADNRVLTITKKDSHGLIFYISPTGKSKSDKILGFRVIGNKIEKISDSGEGGIMSAPDPTSPNQPAIAQINQ